MNAKLKQIGTSVLYILVLYILVFITRPIYIYLIVQNFSNRKYLDDLAMHEQGFQYLMLLGYCVLSFFWTRRTLILDNKLKLKFWMLNWIIDFIILPASVLFMVLYNNKGAIPDIKNLSSVENFFLIWILLAIKHVIFHIASGTLSFGRRKNRPTH